jgi:hypothetical protein
MSLRLIIIAVNSTVFLSRKFNAFVVTSFSQN